MKRIAAAAALVAALALGFLLLGNSRSAEGGAAGSPASPERPAGPRDEGVPVVVTSVQVRPMRQLLEVAGSLKTDEDVEIGSRVEGRVVAVTVREGDRVERGQVLVRLDDREVRAQLAAAEARLEAARSKLSLARNQASWKDASSRAEHERARAAHAAARARLQQAETSLRLIEVETKTKTETAESGVRVAKERLAIVTEATRRQELRQAQLAVEQAKAQAGQAQVDAENARQVFERRKQLFQRDAVAKEEVDEAERRARAADAALQVALAAVAVAEQKLDLADEGSRPEEVRIAQGQLSAAERNLTLARSDEGRRDVAREEVEAARAALGQAEAAVRAAEAGLVQDRISQDEIASARAAIAQAEAEIQLLRTQADDLILRAPVSGVVSTRSVNVGEMVSKSTRLMNLVALDAVFLEAVVPELEVRLLRTGMPAEVTVDAVDGTLRGVVREVIPVADRESRSFRARIAVLAEGRALAPGGYARAVIHVGTRSSAVVVPRDALSTEAGDTYAWRVEEEDGKLVARRRVVSTGLVDSRYAEVLDGLQKGDRVVASGSPAIVDGTAVRISAGARGPGDPPGGTGKRPGDAASD